MSVIVNGLEMPKSCHKCFIKQGSCPAIRKRIQVLPANNHIWVPHNYRYDDCPLGNVPTPHGRLIDVSETVRVQMYDEEHEDWYTVEMTIDDLLGQGWIDAEAPTIIEAEG